MAISIQQFDSLLKIDTASWAIWSDNFNKNGCTESKPENIKGFLKSHIVDLKQNVVLLGLNRSNNVRLKSSRNKKSSFPYSNFHAKGHAGVGLLKSVVTRLSNLYGAYMTDLFLDLQSDSTKVNIEQTKTFEYFVNQLDILGSTYFHIVCFGNKVFSAFQALSSNQPVVIPNSDGVMNLQLSICGKRLNCYKAIHYSYAVRYNRKDRFQRQMIAIDNEIEKNKTR